MREALLYGSFLVAVFGGMFGYLYVTAEVIEVQVIGKRTEQNAWRPGVDTNDYLIETKRNGDIAFSTLPLMGFFWGGGEVFDNIRVGGTYKVRVVNYPFLKAPDNVAIIDVIE